MTFAAPLPVAPMHIALRGSRGIVLFVALVSMLILTLAAAALVRTALVTAAASGNVAMRHNLAIAGLAAVEAAIATIEGPAAIPDLDTDLPARNYYASRQPGEDGRAIPAVLQAPAAYPAGARTLTTGDLGIRFVIERLCTGPGAPDPERCTLSPPSLAAVAGVPEPPRAPGYRMTARIDAADGSAGFVQAMLAAGPPPRRVTWRVIDEE